MLTKYSGTLVRLNVRTFDSQRTVWRFIPSPFLLKSNLGLQLNWSNIHLRGTYFTELCSNKSLHRGTAYPSFPLMDVDTS